MPATTSTARSKAKQQQQQAAAPTPAASQPSSKPATSSSAVQQPSNLGIQNAPSAGFLVTCDAPTKQFIKFLDKAKSADKKFILEDLDANHLLIDGRAKDEILRKIETWMDENVFSHVTSVGENLET